LGCVVDDFLPDFKIKIMVIKKVTIDELGRYSALMNFAE
jgi:hypothetical protein